MKSIKTIAGLFLLIFIFSCGQDINPDEILNKEINFKLTIYLGDTNNSDSIVTQTINKDSPKITILKDWISNNPDGWKSSIASWATPDISLIGTDFRLLIYNDGVVIGFTDKKGKVKQFTKQVNKSEFDFLIR